MHMADIKPTRVVGGVAYFNMTDGAAYLDMSGTGFRNKIRRLGIQQYELPASREKFIKKDDLDVMLQPRPIDKDDE